MELVFSKDFDKKYQRIKDEATLMRIAAVLQRIRDSPEVGKPLRYDKTGLRTIRVPPLRLLYRIEGERVVVLAFTKRDEVYRR